MFQPPSAGLLTFYLVRRRARQRQTIAADAERAARKPESGPSAPVPGGAASGVRPLVGGAKAVVVPGEGDALATYPTRPPGTAPKSVASHLGGGASTTPSLQSSLSSAPTSSIAQDALLAYITSLRLQVSCLVLRWEV